MGEARSFRRSMIKMEDINAAREELKDPHEYDRFIEDLSGEEPGLAIGLTLFSIDEAERFADNVSAEVLEKIQERLENAMAVGYLTHKKAHDRFWDGLDLNSKI